MGTDSENAVVMVVNHLLKTGAGWAEKCRQADETGAWNSWKQ